MVKFVMVIIVVPTWVGIPGWNFNGIVSDWLMWELYRLSTCGLYVVFAVACAWLTSYATFGAKRSNS